MKQYRPELVSVYQPSVDTSYLSVEIEGGRWELLLSGGGIGRHAGLSIQRARDI